MTLDEIENLASRASADSEGFAGVFYFCPEDEHCPDRIMYGWEDSEVTISDCVDEDVGRPIADMLNGNRNLARAILALLPVVRAAEAWRDAHGLYQTWDARAALNDAIDTMRAALGGDK